MYEFANSAPQEPTYTLRDYQYGFTQPTPAYGLKDASGWRTVHQSLSHHVIGEHLAKNIAIGTYGRWYPRFGILDIDDTPLSQVYEICDRLGLGDHNSMVFTSESPNSYHVYFKPVKRGKMLNLNLYLKCMALAREVLNIEIYPQATRFIRLPFGRGQQWVNRTETYPLGYQEGMLLLGELEEYDVERLPYLPELADDLYPSFDEPIFNNFGLKKGWKQEGLALINTGLESYGSRLDALKKVIYFYWSQNVPLETTIEQTTKWMQSKHNGYSKDYASNPRAVLKQISDLTHWTYRNFDHHYILPDSAHIVDKGYLTKALTQEIVIASKGRLPILKFGIELFAYLAPRNVGGNKIAVHSDRLTEWASIHNYLSYLDHYKKAGLIKRDARYKVGAYAKGIRLLTGYTPLESALMWEEDRPLEGLHQVIPAVYSPQEYAQQLKAIGIDRRSVNMQIKEIWQEEASTKQAPVRTKKATTQERIREYLKENPNATQKETAKDLDIGLRTVERYAKK